mgnify:CR=1 FL=1
MREVVTLDISAIEARLASLPDVKPGQQRFDPEEWQLNILRKYWNTKGHDVVAESIGVSIGVARRWYKEACNG